MSARDERMHQALLTITITPAASAAVNPIVIGWTTAVDARHASALARALGATPGEVSITPSAAQVIPSLLGAILGIPAGLGLFAIADPDGPVVPPLGQLAAVLPATAFAVGLLTALPAHLGASRSVSSALRTEGA